MNRVAAEITEEILVFFQHDHVDSGACEQESEHDPGWPAAGNTAARLQRFGGDFGRVHPQRKIGNTRKAASHKVHKGTQW